MSIDVTEFLKIKKPKGKLAILELQIFEILNLGGSYGDAIEFLAMNNVKASRSEVFAFVHAKKRETKLDHPAKIKQNVVVKTKVEKPVSQDLEPSAKSGNGNERKLGELPHFCWNEAKKNSNPKW